MIAKAVNQTIRFLSSFSQKNFRVFQRGCINRGEAVGTIDPAGFFQKLLARDH